MCARSDGSPISAWEVAATIDAVTASAGAAGSAPARTTSQPASVEARATTGIDQIILERGLADMKPRYLTSTHRQVFYPPAADRPWPRYGIGRPSSAAPKRGRSTSGGPWL